MNADDVAEVHLKPDMRPTYRRIWLFMGEFRRSMAGAVGTSLAASVAFALLPWPIRYLIDDVLLGTRLKLGVFGTYNATTTGQKLAVGTGLAVAYLCSGSCPRDGVCSLFECG